MSFSRVHRFSLVFLSICFWLPRGSLASFWLGGGSELYHYITPVDRSQPDLVTLLRPLMGFEFSLLSVGPLVCSNKSNFSALFSSSFINSTLKVSMRGALGGLLVDIGLGLGVNVMLGNVTALNSIWEPTVGLGYKHVSLAAGIYITDAFDPMIKTLSPSLMFYWTL